MKKRIRSVNYTQPEVELLISLVEPKISVIESRKCDAITWQEKESTWKNIEIDFNRLNTSSEVYRDAKCLKLKFDSFKKDIRRKDRILQYERNNLGNFYDNTTQHFSDLEKRVMDMLTPSVERQDSLSDSEQAEVKNVSHEIIEEKSAQEEYYQNNEDNFEEVEEKPIPIFTNDQTSESDVITRSSPQLKDTYTSKIKTPLRNRGSSHVKPGTYSYFTKSNIRKRRIIDERMKESNLEVVNLEKQRIQQEIKKEIIQTQLLQLQYEHQKQIQELEKQHLLLKIQLTKTEIENSKKSETL